MILSLGVLGALVGVAVAAVAASYGADRHFWPWTRCPACGHGASLLTSHACAGSLIRLCPARRDHAPTPRLLWVGIVTAATFCGLGVHYVAQPALLLVSLVEATLLLLLLVIDLELRLVPTPVVGLLVAVALVSSCLWPRVDLWDALLGGAVGFASFAAFVGLARLLCGVGALGLGDAYLALAIGCITGYPRVVGTLVLGIVLGGIAAGTLLLLRRMGLRQTIPYGPFLLAAVIYVLVHGNTMYP